MFALLAMISYTEATFALSCPITDLVTITTAETNSGPCNITDTGHLDIQYQGGTLSNRPSGYLSNDGVIAVSGSLDNQYGASIYNKASLTGEYGSLIINYGWLTNHSPGTMNIKGGLTNLLSGDLSNQGRLKVTGSGGNLINEGELSNSGTLEIRLAYSGDLINRGTLSNGSGATIDSDALVNASGGNLSNDGTIQSYFYLQNHGNVHNRENGSIYINNSALNNSFDGTLINDGTLTNIATINAGIESGSSINNYGILNNNGTLINTGVVSENGVIPTLYNYVFKEYDIIGTLNNSGILINDTESVLENQGILNNDGNINNKGATANTGEFYIKNTGTVTGDGTFTQTAGSSIVNGHLSQSSIIFTGGNLGGNGVVLSSSNPVEITSDVTVNPGKSASSSLSDFTGRLTFGSDVSFNGAMTIEIAGLADFDIIEVKGTANFDSQAVITFDLQGYAPRAGDSFTFLNSNSLTGFTNIKYEFDLPNSLDYTVSLSQENINWPLANTIAQTLSPFADFTMPLRST
jgi:hypothetical protein